jgi:cytochrome c biogenesis protein CcdA
VVAAAALVLLLFALALALATAQDRTVRAMREGAPAVKRWGGRILIAVGVWFLALSIFAGFFARVFPV